MTKTLTFKEINTWVKEYLDTMQFYSDVDIDSLPRVISNAIAAYMLENSGKSAVRTRCLPEEEYGE